MEPIIPIKVKEIKSDHFVAILTVEQWYGLDSLYIHSIYSHYYVVCSWFDFYSTYCGSKRNLRPRVYNPNTIEAKTTIAICQSRKDAIAIFKEHTKPTLPKPPKVTEKVKKGII